MIFDEDKNKEVKISNEKSSDNLNISSDIAIIDDNINIEQNEVILKNEINSIINQITIENNSNKTQALIDLFNINQKKKSIIRLNKLNDLYDIITDQAIERFTKCPDELNNDELFKGLKTVGDMIEKNQKFINDKQDNAPLIQINQQNNELNVGNDSDNLSRESKDKVKNAVAAILASLSINQEDQKKDAIDVTSQTGDENNEREE